MYTVSIRGNKTQDFVKLNFNMAQKSSMMQKVFFQFRTIVIRAQFLKKTMEVIFLKLIKSFRNEVFLACKIA